LGSYILGLLGSKHSEMATFPKQGSEFSECFSTAIFYASWSLLRKLGFGRNVWTPFFLDMHLFL